MREVLGALLRPDADDAIPPPGEVILRGHLKGSRMGGPDERMAPAADVLHYLHCIIWKGSPSQKTIPGRGAFEKMEHF